MKEFGKIPTFRESVVFSFYFPCTKFIQTKQKKDPLFFTHAFEFDKICHTNFQDISLNQIKRRKIVCKTAFLIPNQITQTFKNDLNERKILAKIRRISTTAQIIINAFGNPSRRASARGKFDLTHFSFRLPSRACFCYNLIKNRRLSERKEIVFS